MSFTKIKTRIIKQDDPPRTKRWFRNQEGDLFVWQSTDDRIVAFQFSFKPVPLSNEEHLVEWDARKGLALGIVHAANPPMNYDSPTIQFIRPIDKKILAKGLEYLRLSGGDVPEELMRFLAVAIEAELK